MALQYGLNNATDFASSKLVSFASVLTRTAGQPMDKSQLWYPLDGKTGLERAQEYAASTSAYVGQEIAVIDVAENGSTSVTFYGIQDAAGTLKELGSKPVGDGKSIDVAEDGTVSIHGFGDLTNAEENFLPRIKKVIDTPATEGVEEVSHLEIEWVPISAVVEGDGNSITTVDTVDKSVVITDTAEEDFEGHKYTVKVNVSPEEGNALTLTDNGLYVATPEEYDDSELVEKIDALEEAVGVEADGETPATGLIADVRALENKVDTGSQTVTEYVNAEIGKKIHIRTEVVETLPSVDDAEDGVIYLFAAEGVEAGTYLEYILVEKDGTKSLEQIGSTVTDLSDYAKSVDVVSNDTFEQFKTDNTAAIAKAIEDANLDQYATKQEITDAGYAVASEVEETYAKKATTLEGYGITDAYTKTEAYAKTEVYTKAEVDKLLDDVSGGSSETAASVKRALDGYIQSMDTEVYGAEVVAGWTIDGVYTPTYSATESRIDKLATTVASNTALAQKGVDDAAAVKLIADANTEAINGTKADLASLHNIVNGVDNTSSHAAQLAALNAKDTLLDGEITALKAIDGTLQETVAEHGGKLTALESKDSELAGLIATKANSADVYAKTETYSATEIDTKIGEVAGTIDFKPYLKKDDAAATYATITSVEAIYKVGEGDTAATGLLADEIARATAAEKKLSDDLALLIENPTEALDSVKELIDHVQANGTAVAGIITRLDDHDAILDGIGGEDEPATVIEAINNAIGAIPTATAEVLGLVKGSVDANKVAIATDGTMEVNSISTDKLVQGVDELVLNGGNAKGAAATV